MDEKKIVARDKYVSRTYKIEKELFHQFAVKAAQQGKRHKEIINELLRDYVNSEAVS